MSRFRGTLTSAIMNSAIDLGVRGVGISYRRNVGGSVERIVGGLGRWDVWDRRLRHGIVRAG